MSGVLLRSVDTIGASYEQSAMVPESNGVEWSRMDEDVLARHFTHTGCEPHAALSLLVRHCFVCSTPDI